MTNHELLNLFDIKKKILRVHTLQVQAIGTQPTLCRFTSNPAWDDTAAPPPDATGDYHQTLLNPLSSFKASAPGDRIAQTNEARSLRFSSMPDRRHPAHSISALTPGVYRRCW
jgi:hypothetical protein